MSVAHFEGILSALNLNEGMTADSSCWLLSVQAEYLTFFAADIP